MSRTAASRLLSILLLSGLVLVGSASVHGPSVVTPKKVTRIGYVVHSVTKTVQVVEITWKGRAASRAAANISAKTLGTVTGFKNPVSVSAAPDLALVVDAKRKQVVRIDLAEVRKGGALNVRRLRGETLKTGKGTRSVVVSGDGTTGLVLKGKRDLLMIDVPTMTIIGKFKVGKGAEVVRVDQQGTVAMTVNKNSRSLSLLDIAAARASVRSGSADGVVNVPLPCDPGDAGDVTSYGPFIHAVGNCVSQTGRLNEQLWDGFGIGVDLKMHDFHVDNLLGRVKSVATLRGENFPDGFIVTSCGESSESCETDFVDVFGFNQGFIENGCVTDDPQVVVRSDSLSIYGLQCSQGPTATAGCDGPALDMMIFADGFESGDTSVWSSSDP